MNSSGCSHSGTNRREEKSNMNGAFHLSDSDNADVTLEPTGTKIPDHLTGIANLTKKIIR
jgi:hypothetical protein